MEQEHVENNDDIDEDDDSSSEDRSPTGWLPRGSIDVAKQRGWISEQQHAIYIGFINQVEGDPRRGVPGRSLSEPQFQLKGSIEY